MVVPKERKTDRIAKLARLLNFSVKTNNGCRYFGPTIGNKTVPPKGTEIFVGRIPDDAYEDEIYQHFENFGNIFRIKLTLNLDCTTKGYCFVKYQTTNDAQRAVEQGGLLEFRRNSNIFLHVDFSTDTSTLEVTGFNHITTSCKVKKDIIQHCDIIAPFVISELPNVFVVDFVENQDANIVLKKLTPISQELWGGGASIQWQFNENVTLREIKKKYWERRKMLKNEWEINNIVGDIIRSRDYDRLHVVPEKPALQSTSKREDSGVNSHGNSPDVNAVQNRETKIILPQGAELAIIQSPNGFGQYSCLGNNSISDHAGAALPVIVHPVQYGHCSGHLGLTTATATLPTAASGGGASTLDPYLGLPYSKQSTNFGVQLGVTTPQQPASDAEGTLAARPYHAKPLLYSEQAASAGAQVSRNALAQLLTSECDGASAADLYVTSPLVCNEQAANRSAQLVLQAGIAASVNEEKPLGAHHLPAFEMLHPTYNPPATKIAQPYTSVNKEKPLGAHRLPVFEMLSPTYNPPVTAKIAQPYTSDCEGACALDYVPAQQSLACNGKTANSDDQQGSSNTASYQLIPPVDGNERTKFISPQFQNDDFDKIWYYGASNGMEQTVSSDVLQGAEQQDGVPVHGINPAVTEDSKSSSEAVIQKLNHELAKMLNSSDPGTVKDAGLIKHFFRNALTNETSSTV